MAAELDSTGSSNTCVQYLSLEIPMPPLNQYAAFDKVRSSLNLHLFYVSDATDLKSCVTCEKIRM